MEEGLANRHWQTNGNRGLGANIGMHFNFFSSSFHSVRIYTLVQRSRNTHRCSHTTYSDHTLTELQVLIYIQLEMSIYSSRNLPLIINTNVCRCAQAWIVLFVSDFWCFVAILCVRAGISLCLCQSVVMRLGYQVCASRQPPLLASHHTERSFDGSAASSSFFCSIFSFDSQTQ